MRIYLAGPITEDPETHNWRKKAIRLLGDKFECDNPCATRYVYRFAKELIKESEGDSKKFKEAGGQHQAEILLPKSFQSVEKCDIILVNFAIEPTDRPSIGTIMEIAWAWALHRTLIVIGGRGYYTNHPMITGTVNAWAQTVEEATEIIREFFTTKK